MQSHRDQPSPGDLASEIGGLNTGLGILTMTFMPFALPALLLGLLVVLPALPLLVLAAVGYAIVRGVRGLMRSRLGFAHHADRRDRAGAGGRDRARPHADARAHPDHAA